MKGIHVVITKASPYEAYGNYEYGDTGTVVGFTQGCAVVVLDENGKFVKVELRNIKSLDDL
jgi:hypothetical protein